MKILVAISHVPDTTAKIQFSADKSTFQSQGITYIINPYDEWYALVRAIELKEQGKASHVTLIHVGLADAEATLRKGLALGADDAVRIDINAADTFEVAFQIAEYARSQQFDIILTGKETIQYNSSAVGGILAGILDLPFVSYTCKLEHTSASTLQLEAEIDGGTQVLECSMPAVISCAKGMAEQRIPNMRGIMAARSKPLQVLTPQNHTEKGKTITYELNPGRSACQYFTEDQMDELVSLLHTQAKVI